MRTVLMGRVAVAMVLVLGLAASVSAARSEPMDGAMTAATPVAVGSARTAGETLAESLGLLPLPRPDADPKTLYPEVVYNPGQTILSLQDALSSKQNEIISLERQIEALRQELSFARSFVTVSNGPRSGNLVAITVDDLGTDLALVAIRTAEAKQAKLTLFPMAYSIKAHPDWFLEALGAGFELGNHTTTHEFLSRLTLEKAEGRVTGWNEVAAALLGYQPRFFRPPGGDGWTDGRGEPALREIVARHGMITVLWDVETVYALYKPTGPRWKGPHPSARDVADYVVGQARPGSIILLHDNLDVYALPMIIDGLRAKGLEPVTVSELLGLPPPKPPAEGGNSGRT